ncbi:FAD-binding oxidoreductase [Roseobacter sp. YSTF-M11]|uniref:FAD-binding oxidoreductase n=1 Tax=Roseobacter insulae TaxID=2859783 RepID=A0A9X1FVI0_9RHOB|nr:FAD-binding oxidoreductase [Roseobacter insulae]MBW4708412.1 FAD-binding oxidoreductase [Roseobacter insulae]
MTRVDVVVIGGGIVGLMTAWHLAREGARVALLEAGDLGAQASGANAGSLHLQIQYPEFAKYGEGWARAYAPTLRFLEASIGMWQDLGQEVGEDLDVRLGGGIVVARDPAQMRLIEAKARIEASVGVETQILDRDALLALAPYLSDKAIGGGYCAGEGKANPLRATPAIARTAEAEGATVHCNAPVTGLAGRAGAFVVTTPQGRLQADKVVNTAGAKAAKIAAMLGMQIDIGGFPLQVTVTEPIAPLIPHLVYSAAGKLSLKQAANGGCIIGGGWSADVRSHGGLATNPVNFAGNMAMAAGVVPRLAQARTIRSWTAWVNGTPDWRPIIGEAPDIPGFYLALFPWVGFTAGPMTARVIADLVMGRAPAIDLTGISVLAD